MGVLMVVLFIFLAASFWRLRGISHGWAWAGAFALLCAAILLQHGVSVPLALAYALWVWLGERPGWGVAIGRAVGRDGESARSRAEWYQRMFSYWLWDRPWLALAFRGFLIGGIGAIAMPLAVWLTTRLPDPLWPKSWRSAWWEFYFGGLFVIILEAVLWLV